MSQITGEATHVVSSTNNDHDPAGPTLEMGPEEGNVILRALASSHHNAMRSLVKAQTENDPQAVASALGALMPVERALGIMQGAAQGETQATLDDGRTLGAITPQPQDLATIVSSLVAYSHNVAGGLEDIKSGKYVVVDKADTDERGPNEVLLADYNAIKEDLVQAPSIAGKMAAYIREAYPEVLKVSLDYFVQQSAPTRTQLIATPTELPIGSVWNGMLASASLLFDLSPDILDAMVEAAGSTRN